VPGYPVRHITTWIGPFSQRTVSPVMEVPTCSINLRMDRRMWESWSSQRPRGTVLVPSSMMNLVHPLWTLPPSSPHSAAQFPDHDTIPNSVNPQDIRATILSSVPPISIPLHARQELCSFPSKKKKNSAVVFVAARYVFVDGNMRTKEACLEKAETNIERAHIVVLVVCACVVDWWSIGFLEYL